MNGCPFWYDGCPIGGVPGLLSLFGVVFRYGWYDPPLPPFFERWF
jgi:hypothetical protein